MRIDQPKQNDVAREMILQKLLVADNENASLVPSNHPTYSYIERGILNKDGGFACLAAHWYYNSFSFPNRAVRPPASLDELVVLTAKAFSQKRLLDSKDSDDGFPKEAAFRQLFNEAANRYLPAFESLAPETSTKAGR